MKKEVFIFGLSISLLSCSETTDISNGKVSDDITFCIDREDGSASFLQGATRGVQDSILQKTRLVSATGDSLFLTVSGSNGFEQLQPDSQKVSTRGSLATKNDITEFGVSASVYDADESYTSAGCGSYFCDIRAVPNVPCGYYWPSRSKKVSFFAHWPYDNDNLVISSISSDAGSPVYAYTVPSEIGEQVDVMTAQVLDHLGGSSAPVPLTFSHHCSAIRFTFDNSGSDMITVQSVSIINVKSSGTLQDGSWTLDDDLSTFTLSCNTSVEASETADLTGTDNILLMLPQTLPDGALLRVVTSNDTYESPLTGAWDANNVYVYNIRVSEQFTYHLNVTEPPAISYAGGTSAYGVQSYKENDLGRQIVVPWTAEYSLDGGETWSATMPGWMTAFTASGVGSTTVSEYDVTVAPQVSTNYITDATSVMKAVEPASDLDLSMYNSDGSERATRSTANCYMVHRPGTYKLPLVYGNAIKDGATNTRAFAPSGTNGDTFLTPFLNHAGNGITDPWLKNNGATPDAAELLWQDAAGLITSVGISGDYLTFTVSEDDITEGNALIAAKSGGTIVWSWHIWVTTETYAAAAVIQTDNHTYTMAPTNLGWVTFGNVTVNGYAQRSCIVRVTQGESEGLSETFTVMQYAHIIGIIPAPAYGYNTHYQWGRKDPAVPSTGNQNQEVYDITGEVVTGFRHLDQPVTAGQTIQNPTTHYDETFGSQNNIWDATQDDWGSQSNATVKTVYDPCPPGFCVPTSDLWHHIVSIGDEGSSTESIYDDEGHYLGCFITSTNPNMFLPCTGCRSSWDGSVINGNSCWIWSANTENNNESFRLYIQGDLFGFNAYPKAYSFAIRPVSEE